MKADGSDEVEASPFKSLVGSLWYLTATRSDIMFVTSLMKGSFINHAKIILVREKEC